MSAEIVYSTDALIDLDEAWDFTVETSGDPDLAFQQVDALLEAVEGARSFPLAGSRLDVVVGAGWNPLAPLSCLLSSNCFLTLLRSRRKSLTLPLSSYRILYNISRSLS